MPQSRNDLAELLRASGRIVVLTGAGISTDSGIPDFRGPEGVWTKDPAAELMFTLDNYVADPDVRRRAWLARTAIPARTAVPNTGHDALVHLDRQGRLLAVVTQNVDGLHQAAGLEPDTVIEIHGTARWVLCMNCGLRTPAEQVLNRVDAGEPDPVCAECGGMQKAATISFGEMLDPAVLDRALAAARDCDLMLAVGTSLAVHPAAGLCDLAKRAGARLAIVNNQPTPYDREADLVVRQPIGDVLPWAVAHL